MEAAGGVLVESMLHGNNSVGIDFESICSFTNKVKMLPPSLMRQLLETAFNQTNFNSKKDKENKADMIMPQISYQKNQKKKL